MNYNSLPTRQVPERGTVMQLPKNLGMLSLGIFLLLWGLLTWPIITFPSSNLLLAALAVIAGVLILLGR
jgi:hypothetical protein